MLTDINSLRNRYLECCTDHSVVPNQKILWAFFTAEIKKGNREVCSLELLLDELKALDVLPLLYVFLEIHTSEIEAVYMIQKSSCPLDGLSVLSLLRTLGQKLWVLDLEDWTFGKNFLSDISLNGLACQVLKLRNSSFQKLNMIGDFMQLHTLNLDFSASLTGFQADCFTRMPNLKCLSMCGTRLDNIWMTAAAMAKLPSLVELRFQSCFCCHGTGPCPKSSVVKAREGAYEYGLHIGTPSLATDETTSLYADVEDEVMSIVPMDDFGLNYEFQSVSDYLFADRVDSQPGFDSAGRFSYVSSGRNWLVDQQTEVSSSTWGGVHEDESWPSSSSNLRFNSYLCPEKRRTCHASPICHEKYYREFMIASLPRLEILDNLQIEKFDRDRARFIFSVHFERLPYKRSGMESLISILQKREIRASRACVQTSRKNPVYASGKSPSFYSKSLCAAKVGLSAWPALRPLSVSGSTPRGDRAFRPRQFEYHPSDSSLMVIGTLDGEVVVVNHESEKIVSYIPSDGVMNSVLGLCWLKKYPSKLISGSDDGQLILYDIRHYSLKAGRSYPYAGSVLFEEFDNLTSVHVNSTDDLFLASGYSKHVALYDISSGRRLQVFTDMHQEHINVVKFSNHSPSIFATSSFDHDVKMWDLRLKPVRPCYTVSSGRGNVMACFSPDDQYLLVSAVDNEVKQLLAVDGRLHLEFDIPSIGSSQNYTRSYYMNGKDYVITGSCDEHVARICCAQTGRRLRDITLEGKCPGSSMFVQSLRGDPFRDFHLSILAAYLCPDSYPEIVKVNMMASDKSDKENCDDQNREPLNNIAA